jgi:hypothetical protein
MISIILKDSQNQRQKYLDMVGASVMVRLQNMQRSIGHLDGTITAANDQEDFTGYKSTTEALVALTATTGYDFNSAKYVKSIKKYIDGADKLPGLALTRISAFLKYLTEADGNELDALLLCAPLELAKKNKKLIVDFDLGAGIEAQMVKIAFDYDDVPKIGGVIRTFFREENLVTFCPYCNKGDAIYIDTEYDNAAEIHQLDHYFFKADHPLLCYSFFNLVPADVNCNGKINKGSIRFDDNFYLNPYSGGFGQALTFKLIGTGKNISQIELVLKGSKGVKLFDQMVGTSGIIDERTRSGNINVFKLKDRYNDEYTWKKAGKAVVKVQKKAAERRSLKDFFKRMNKDVKVATHLTWYDDVYDGCFHPVSFNDERYAKLYRDIHDAVFNKDTRHVNNVIRLLISQHPQ